MKSVAAVAQSVAVILGVAVTVNELVLKDRAADRARLELSMRFADDIRSQVVRQAQQQLHALRDTAYMTPVDSADMDMRLSMDAKIDERTRDLAHFYAKVQTCVAARVCDEAVAAAVVCEDADRDLEALDEIRSRVGDRFFTERYFAGLRAFEARCAKSTPARGAAGPRPS